MTSARFICKRPYATDEETRVVRYARHGCDGKQHGSDALIFPIGWNGQGMPRDVPFEVISTEPCGRCGSLVHVWAQWEKQILIAFGDTK